MESRQVIGVIGVGAMGGSMAKRLLAKGHSVWVRDIDSTREVQVGVLGAKIATSAAALVDQVKTIFIVVVNEAQIEEVLFSEQGVLARLRPGHQVFFCSTIAPERMKSFCEQVIVRGAQAFDAPISGGPARAEAGTMSMMLAGNQQSLALAKSLLEDMAAKRFVISSNLGDATKAKLVNNLMAGINLLAGAEALAFAEKLGLDAKQMLALISASSGQSWMCDDRMTRALEGDFNPRAASPVITKDVRLAKEYAERQGLQLPLGSLAWSQLQKNVEAGHQSLDDAATLLYYRKLFGVS